MKLLQNAQLLVRRPEVFLGRRRYVLVLSHMRSYSSLLCHILGSHPEVAGYAEMHQSYNGPLDLLRLRARVSRSLDGELSGRFVLDKVLHNEYAIATPIIRRAEVYPIFLVRNSVDSIQSIIKMGERVRKAAIYSDPDATSSYYVGRLHELARLAEERRVGALFIKAEDLVDETTAALESISRFLRLAEPLRGSYSTFKHTGEPGWGDDSAAIRAGRILPNRREDAALNKVPKEAFSRAAEAYAACCLLLEHLCDTAGADSGGPR